MSNVSIPDTPHKKEGIWKEGEWREQWKVYNDLYVATQMDHKIRLLLKWFKEDFFTWVNSPQCASCGVRIQNSFWLTRRAIRSPLAGLRPQRRNEGIQLVRSN